ncbi:MAG: cyclic nucleotide-binding domain-containing protein [Candidatus Binatia bacterium]|nr:cyclic nucleotide-binding domain-containing protein [Candidatus Binatia bacterium]
MAAPGEVLRNLAIFGALSDETLEFLYDRLETVTVAAGESFFVEGETGDSVYVLEDGCADVVKSREGRTIALATLEPGACFGEIALVAICPRSATVNAVTACRAVRLENRVLFELHGRDLEQFTLVQMNLAREIARRLNETSELLFEHLLVEAKQDTRVAGLLGNALK